MQSFFDKRLSDDSHWTNYYPKLEVPFVLRFNSKLWLSFKNKIYTDRKLIYLALSLVFARSYLAGYLGLLEARFSVTQMPIIEIIVTLSLIDAFSKWKKSRVY